MTGFIFSILIGFNFVLFPCEGKIILLSEKIMIVAPGTDATIEWSFDDVIKKGDNRAWSFVSSDGKPTERLARIIDDGDPEILATIPGVSINKPATLVLKNVDLLHNGTYSFTLFTDKTYISDVLVLVAVEPTMTVLCSTSITVDEDENVTCLCQGKNGQPPANVTWYKDGVQQGDTGDEKNILSLSNVKETAAGTYNCVGQSYTLKAEKSIKLIVRPSVRPTVTSFTSGNAVLGKSVTLTCEAEGRPSPTYTIIHNDTHQVSNEKTYKIDKVKYSDAGLYKCTAKNKLGDDSKDYSLTVLVMPIVTVNCSSPVTVNEGDNVKCLCKGEGGNPPAKVTWYKDSVQQGVAGNKENMLSLSNVDKADSGTYKCAAQSYVLTDEESIEIIIYYAVPPAVTSLTSTPEKAFLGKTVVITCEAIAVPVPSYIIIQNDTALVSTKKTYIIPVMDYTHAGSYKCIAKNILGSSSKTFSLSVVGLVQKTTVAMAIANSLNKVESVVVWHIVVSLLSGILVGVLLVYIIQYSRRWCRNSKLESNPEPPTAINIDSIYQDLDLNRMNKEENYESLRSVNCDSNDPSGKNESDYTDLKLDRVVEDNYQSLTKT